jgi:hypothetical protein
MLYIIIGLLATVINSMLQPLRLQFIAAYLHNIVAKLAQKIVLAIGCCSQFLLLQAKFREQTANFLGCISYRCYISFIADIN